MRDSDTKLNILMICPDFKPNLGGEAELAYSLATAFHELGHNLTVLAPPCTTVVEEADTIKFNLIRKLDLGKLAPISSPRVWFSFPIGLFRIYQTINSILKKNSIQICFVTTYSSWTLIILWLLKTRYAMFLHGEELTWSRDRGGFSDYILNKACNKARWLFFNSNYSRNILTSSLPDVHRTSESVGCGVSMSSDWTTARRDEARKILDWDDGPVLLTVSRLVIRKGIDTVIAAMNDIVKNHPNCKYIIVGDGPDKETIKKLISKSPVRNSIRMVGRVDQETKEMMYAASDVFIMASYPGTRGEEEGFGISFLEANWHGLPVIGSKCGGIEDCIDHNINGLLVKPKSPNEIAIAVTTLLDDNNFCTRLAKQGQERIKTMFNWQTVATKISNRLTSINHAESPLNS